jgi:hypothetical protein
VLSNQNNIDQQQNLLNEQSNTNIKSSKRYNVYKFDILLQLNKQLFNRRFYGLKSQQFAKSRKKLVMASPRLSRFLKNIDRIEMIIRILLKDRFTLI